ncbi:MAG TPA: prolipoprotein diacylglyceryl transferase family protein [Polyangiaceae bacterium]|nr:prolipoprotein diacylglyceryl transferase family protein [Polyangiaceae bacterium]
MNTPSIPYVELPVLPLWPGQEALSLKPFGLLVAIGVSLGAASASRYGKRRGLDAATLTSFIYWVVGSGFVFGHVLDVLLYSPERLKDDPLAIIRLWDGLSSYGGFVGGVLGALAFRIQRGVPVLPYADVVASGLPLGWVFGRAGCAVVHDHPGILSQAWFAVRFPGGGRLDLGLLEMALSIPLAVAFALLKKRAWPWGFFIAWMCAIYGPLRFALDFLRVAEPTWIQGSLYEPDRRYLTLTPAQWASLLVFAFGLYMLLHVRSRVDRDSAFFPPKPATRAEVVRARRSSIEEPPAH